MCSSCGGRRVRNQQLQKAGAMQNTLLGEGAEKVTVLYLSTNVAMHTVYSRCYPIGDNGAVVENYGRHRGARQEEIDAIIGSKTPIETAKEINAYRYSVFEIFKCDYDKQPHVFRVLVQPDAVAVEELADVASREDLTLIEEESEVVKGFPMETWDAKYLTKATRQALIDMGITTSVLYEFIYDANSPDVSKIVSAFEDSKTITAAEKAQSVYDQAVEANNQ